MRFSASALTAALMAATSSATVVQTVVNRDDLTTLETAVLAAGLEVALGGAGPFTYVALISRLEHVCFAPDNWILLTVLFRVLKCLCSRRRCLCRLARRIGGQARYRSLDLAFDRHFDVPCGQCQLAFLGRYRTNHSFGNVERGNHFLCCG